jgi:hypothetical protein
VKFSILKAITFLFMTQMAITAIGQVKMFSNDELPSNHVYLINQDNDGFIWILTEEGMVKFDGQKTRVFTIADGLPTNDIWGSEVTGDKIWFISKGKRQGYIRNDSVFSFNYPGGDFSPQSYAITEDEVLLVDEQSHLTEIKGTEWRKRGIGYSYRKSGFRKSMEN